MDPVRSAELRGREEAAVSLLREFWRRARNGAKYARVSRCASGGIHGRALQHGGSAVGGGFDRPHKLTERVRSAVDFFLRGIRPYIFVSRFCFVRHPVGEENMKAAVLHGFKTPLSLEEVARPEAAADEVLIEVEVCGVCHSDLHVADGDWTQLAGIVKKPLILGHEIVGRVVERVGQSSRRKHRGRRPGRGAMGAVDMRAM